MSQSVYISICLSRFPFYIFIATDNMLIIFVVAISLSSCRIPLHSPATRSATRNLSHQPSNWASTLSLRTLKVLMKGPTAPQRDLTSHMTITSQQTQRTSMSSLQRPSLLLLIIKLSSSLMSMHSHRNQLINPHINFNSVCFL